MQPPPAAAFAQGGRPPPVREGSTQAVPTEDGFSPHQARLVGLWQRMVKIVGIHTVSVLIERAIWEASQAHPELALIQHSDERFDSGFSGGLCWAPRSRGSHGL